MKKLLYFFWVWSCLALHATDKLSDYYRGKIDLTESEILHEVDIAISQQTSKHLVSYAYYLKAVREQNQDVNFHAFETLEKSLKYLSESDTTDHFLKYAILNKQGVILKQHWMIDGAIEKYEQALNPAFAYSFERGLSIKYNLARAWAIKEPEKAVEMLLEILNEAKKEKLNDRVSKVYNELGLILVRSAEYDGAQTYFDKALEYAEGKEELAFTYQNYAHMHYESQQYEKQRNWLEKSLALGNHRNRFVSLMDLGENFLIAKDTGQAKIYLLEAEQLYEDRPLKADYVKVFKWLSTVAPDFLDQLRYERKRGDELEKIVIIQQKLEAKLKQQAMLQLVNRLESEKAANRTISDYKILAVIGGILALGILFTWRIWWYRLRKNLGKKILAMVNRWAEEDSGV